MAKLVVKTIRPPKSFSAYRNAVARVLREAKKHVCERNAEFFQSAIELALYKDYEGPRAVAMGNGWFELQDAYAENEKAGIRRIDIEGVWEEHGPYGLRDAIFNHLDYVLSEEEVTAIDKALRHFGFFRFE